MYEYDIDDIYEVLYTYPRSEWKEKISTMILRDEGDYCIISDNKEKVDSEFIMPLHLSSLDPAFQIPFDEQDLIQDSKGNQYFIPFLPAVDMRREGNYQYNHIIDTGDRTELVSLNKTEGQHIAPLGFEFVYIDPNSTEYTKISEDDLEPEFRQRLHEWWEGKFEI